MSDLVTYTARRTHRWNGQAEILRAETGTIEGANNPERLHYRTETSGQIHRHRRASGLSPLARTRIWSRASGTYRGGRVAVVSDHDELVAVVRARHHPLVGRHLLRSPPSRSSSSSSHRHRFTLHRHRRRPIGPCGPLDPSGGDHHHAPDPSLSLAAMPRSGGGAAAAAAASAPHLPLLLHTPPLFSLGC